MITSLDSLSSTLRQTTLRTSFSEKNSQEKHFRHIRQGDETETVILILYVKNYLKDDGQPGKEGSKFLLLHNTSSVRLIEMPGGLSLKPFELAQMSKQFWIAWSLVND